MRNINHQADTRGIVKRHTAPLTLRREVIRLLTDRELTLVAGGGSSALSATDNVNGGSCNTTTK